MENGATASAAAAPSQARKWRRVHGLQAPLHPQQVCAWLLLLAFAALQHLLVAPALASAAARAALHAAGAALYAAHAVAHLAATVVDPADPNLRAKGKEAARRPVPKFDRSRHAHVIENGRCHLCEISISSQRTKHCSACNKCVDAFDHHCKWLNQCIGQRNYAAFLAAVVTAVLIAVLYLCAAGTVMAFFYVDKSQLRPWSGAEELMRETTVVQNVTTETATTTVTTTTEASATSESINRTNGSRSIAQLEQESLLLPQIENLTESSISSTATTTTESPTSTNHSDLSFEIFSLSIPNAVVLTVLGLSISLALISVALLAHLLFFHLYINRVGITTYEYVRAQRLEQERRARESASSSSSNERDAANAPKSESKKSSGISCCRCCSKRETQVNNFNNEENENDQRPLAAKRERTPSGQMDQIEVKKPSRGLLSFFRSSKKGSSYEEEAEAGNDGQTDYPNPDEVFTISVEQRELARAAPAPPKPPRRVHSLDSSSASGAATADGGATAPSSSSPSTDLTNTATSSAATTDSRRPRSPPAMPRESTVPKLPSITTDSVSATRRGRFSRRPGGEMSLEDADGIPGATEIITLRPN